MRRIRVPHLLLALSIVPILGGAMRLSALTGAVHSSAVDRFALEPWPVVLHIVAASIYCIVGAFQFADRLRKTRPVWHRRAGRVIAVGGFIAAISGLWMTIAYPIPAPLQGELLFLARIVVGVAMAAFLILGVFAIVNGDVRRHRAWMARAYALAQGAGTQARMSLDSFAMPSWSRRGFST